MDVDALLASPLVPAAQVGIAAPISLYGWTAATMQGRANSNGRMATFTASRLMAAEQGMERSTR